MKNKYKVSITRAAENDLDEIYSYIANDLFSSNTAESLIDEIEEKILSLGEFPYRNALSRDETLSKRGYRPLIIKRYVALYLIDEDKKVVTVARVLHGSMDYKNYV